MALACAGLLLHFTRRASLLWGRRVRPGRGAGQAAACASTKALQRVLTLRMSPSAKYHMLIKPPPCFNCETSTL